MSMVINEWQLDVKLNRALQNAQRTDFALYLALLSPAVEESAQFYTPDAIEQSAQLNLYQQLGVALPRSLAQTEADTITMLKQSKALGSSGLAQLKLATYLNPPPLARHDDKQRLADDVWQNLSLHSRRRLQHTTPEKPQANPADLYEVLQQLHGSEAA
ncbi:hypothetical protein M2404_001961 [Rheinheimera pacifica]|uniref:VC2046/SO_2500 family protein n=1 Tax=Rheinheimera pacifica TaxID=173990 RepID=UPI0021679976|nr:VC2046/SO_2500 family protein [Rheinheimera pacifica]MCS4307627.1 hypothetical protein [Rheinheimera pacifica]